MTTRTEMTVRAAAAERLARHYSRDEIRNIRINARNMDDRDEYAVAHHALMNYERYNA